MIAIVLFVLDVVIIARKQNKNETNLVIIAIVVIERNKKNRSLLQVVIERGRTASLPVQQSESLWGDFFQITLLQAGMNTRHTKEQEKYWSYMFYLSIFQRVWTFVFYNYTFVAFLL